MTLRLMSNYGRRVLRCDGLNPKERRALRLTDKGFPGQAAAVRAVNVASREGLKIHTVAAELCDRDRLLTLFGLDLGGGHSF